MKKTKCYIAILMMALCVVFLSSCSNQQNKEESIVGEWIVKSYVVDGVSIDPEDIGECNPDIYGEYLEQNFNESSFAFFDDGTFALKWSDFNGGYRNGISEYELAGSVMKLMINDDVTLASFSDGELVLSFRNNIKIVYAKKG